METEKKLQNKQNIQHPLFGISTKNWIRLIQQNGGIDRNYLKRGIFITCSSIVTAPARTLFKIQYESKIKKMSIQHPPVIIIGHWRVLPPGGIKGVNSITVEDWLGLEMPVCGSDNGYC